MLRSESLTDRQRQILDGIVAGRSNSVIAAELGITMDGVKWHVSELLGESGFSSRGELAEWWRHETLPRVAPAFVPLRIPSHPAAVAAVRVAVVVVIAAVIAAGIVVAAMRRTERAAVVVPAPPEKLAYVKDGDIWVKVLPDGAPRQITHRANDQDAYSSPRWSASGEWLTFVAGKQVGVMRADGIGARELENAAAWAPAGDRFAMVDGASAIVTDNADGSDRRVVVPAPPKTEGVSISMRDLAWSPDGRWIAYSMLKQSGSGTPPARSASIWFVNADGGTPEKAYDAGSPSRDDVQLLGWVRAGYALMFAIDPSFSASALADGLPLGVLRVRQGQPHATDIAPSPPTMLLSDELREVQPSGTGNAPRTTEPLVAITDGAGRETWTNKRIAVVSWASGTIVDLTDAGTAAMAPTWSPDGARIAYVAAPDAGSVSGGDEAKAAMAQRKIWVMDADGSNQRQLTDDPAYRDEAPRWSSDGAQIYFMRLDPQDRWSLWVMGADGAGARQLVDGLSPNLATPPDAVWFGYYGLVEWSGVLNYWRGTAR